MRRLIGRARALLIAGLLIIALTAAAVPLLNLTVYSPTRVVDAYFSALADGDAAAALGMLAAPPHSERTPQNALTDEVLAGAPAVPEHVRITSTERDGDTARVRVRYNLGSATRTTDLTLQQGPATWGLFERWAIAFDEWPQLSLQISGSGTADVNGVEVPAGDGPVPVLFPMGYNIGFNAEYLTSEVKQVMVTGSSDDMGVALQPTPTPALTAEVKRQIEEHLAGCVRATTLMPTGCTFGYETENEIIGEVSWRMLEDPQVSLRSSGSQLSLVRSPAVAEVSGTYRDSVTGFEFDFREEVPFTLGAEVIVTGDEVRVEPNSGAKLGG